ncbi:MAG: hypothetical protein KGI25_05730 [Thaumarchaeota archaeon]|nr:hypothetical protein [Nitrososphaerota archaeon]
MKSKKYAYIGIGAVAIAVVVISLTQFNLNPSSTVTTPTGIDAYTLGFTYETVNSDLKGILIGQNINMSKPLKFSTTSDIDQYCNFLSNQTKQDMIQYCTSTEIKDEHENFLGNLNMVGSTIAPVLVIATAETDPLFSNYKDTKILFNDVINETVCQCWAKEKPGGYATLSDMMDALRDFHLKGKEPNSTTHGVPLGGEHFEIELSTNTQGYLWKLLVAK